MMIRLKPWIGVPVLLAVFVSKVNSQESIVSKGTVRSQLTLSPSLQLSDGTMHFSAHGTLEAYLSDELSVAGDGYYNLGSPESESRSFEFNHRLFFGPAWHVTRNNHDLAIGVQPGMSLARLHSYGVGGEYGQIGVNPLVSIFVGYNLYVHKNLHFFLQSRGSFGSHARNQKRDISELSFSAGLGFNLNAM